MELGWNTPILMSVSDNMTMFKSVKLPFKNILKVACTTGIQYCASTFKDEKRDADHWINGAQIIVLDFDEGLNEFTKSWLDQQFGFLIPTKSFMKEKRGVVCERYRAILLVDQPMTISAKEYVRTYQNLHKDNNLPADPSCTDVSRLYYGFGDPALNKYIKILSGKPLDWTKYNYEDTIERIGLPSPKKFVDVSKYEDLIDLNFVTTLNKSKRYECPICALDGLDPHKHHMGFSSEKDLITCFYDKEGHSPILRALYRKQVLGLEPELDEEWQEIVEEEIQQADGKVKKKKVVRPKMEDCSYCAGSGKIHCTECGGTGMKLDQGHQIPCTHCNSTGFFPCPECQGTGKVPKKPKPKVKKPSLPDDMIPLRDRNPKGLYHFNEKGPTLDFESEIAKYVNSPILGLDVETYFNKEVSITLEEAVEKFKSEYVSTKATYTRVVKNLKEKALDEIDNTVRLFIIGDEIHQTAFDLSICTPEQISRLLTLTKQKIVVGHNLKFDFKSLASIYGINILPKSVFDTMLGSKMLWMAENTFEPIGTNTYGSIVERFMGVHLPKDQGGSDWGQSELTTEQLIYAINDVRFLVPIFKKMCEQFFRMYKTDYRIDPMVDLEKLRPTLGRFIDIHPVMALEMRFLMVLVRMELKGVKVNESALRDMVKVHLEEIEEAEKKLGFNPASNPECAKFVKMKIGAHMDSANKDALAEYYHIPEIELLGRAKQAKARAGLMVKMYEHKDDGRIHPQFTQILSTARLACKNPNMQQIPRTVKSKIYAAEPGTFVCSADYPAIELRLGAVYHKEPVMIEAFKNGEDLHYKMAQIMTGKPIPKTDEEKADKTGTFINKEERTAAKNANFGYCYGSWWTSYQKVQLVKNHIKISDQEAQEARKSFMTLYRTLAQHIETTKYEFKNGKPRMIQMKDSLGNMYSQQVPYLSYIHTLFGRKIAVETANTALNYPVQGSGGDISKIAMCLFEDICEAENINGYLINMVHDDIVAEGSIEHKPLVKNALARAMNDAANFLMGHYFSTDVTAEVEVLAETPLESIA